MAVALIERVPVDRINKQAKDVRFWRTVALALAGLLWGLGWILAKSFAVIWLGLVWAAAAVKVGWADARQAPAGERGTG